MEDDKTDIEENDQHFIPVGEGHIGVGIQL